MMLGGNDHETRAKTCNMFSEGKFEVILHGDHSFAFVESDVIDAFQLIEMRKGH